jgi:tetratricopeptide (TPR) repeat protein
VLLVVLIFVTALVVTAHVLLRHFRPGEWTPESAQGGGSAHRQEPPEPPLTPEEQWTQLIEQAKKTAQEPNWALAEQQLEKAREIARAFPAPDLRLAENEYLLAGVYRQQFKDAEAFMSCKDALAIREKALGKDDLLVADTWRGLGQLYEERGLASDAERCLKQGLEIQVRKLGEDDVAVARTRSEMARLYLAHQRPDEAERLARQALAVQEKKLKLEDPELIVTRLNLGDALYHQEKYDELEKETTPTLEVFQKVAGEDHPQVAVLLRQLATVRQHQKRYDDASKLLWRAVRIQEEKLKEHADLVISLLSLADVQLDQKMAGEAENQFRRALAVWEKLKPEKQPRLIALATALARRFYEAGKKDVAREMLKRTLGIVDRVKPAVDSLLNEIMQPYAWLCAETGELTEAEKQFQRLILLQKRIYETKEHPVIFVNMGAYIHVLRLLEKNDEMMKTIDAAERLRGGAVQRQLEVAKQLQASGQLADAKRAEEMAERIRTQSLTDPFPQPVPIPSFRLPSP